MSLKLCCHIWMTESELRINNMKAPCGAGGTEEVNFGYAAN